MAVSTLHNRATDVHNLEVAGSKSCPRYSERLRKRGFSGRRGYVSEDAEAGSEFEPLARVVIAVIVTVTLAGLFPLFLVLTAALAVLPFVLVFVRHHRLVLQGLALNGRDRRLAVVRISSARGSCQRQSEQQRDEKYDR
jgi:hypothetical protein